MKMKTDLVIVEPAAKIMLAKALALASQHDANPIDVRFIGNGGWLNTIRAEWNNAGIVSVYTRNQVEQLILNWIQQTGGEAFGVRLKMIYASKFKATLLSTQIIVSSIAPRDAARLSEQMKPLQLELNLA